MKPTLLAALCGSVVIALASTAQAGLLVTNESAVQADTNGTLDVRSASGNILALNRVDGNGELTRVLNVDSNGTFYISLQKSDRGTRFVMQHGGSGALLTSGPLIRSDDTLNGSGEVGFVTQGIDAAGKFNGDVGYVTEAGLASYISGLNGEAGYVTEASLADQISGLAQGTNQDALLDGNGAAGSSLDLMTVDESGNMGHVSESALTDFVREQSTLALPKGFALTQRRVNLPNAASFADLSTTWTTVANYTIAPAYPGELLSYTVNGSGYADGAGHVEARVMVNNAQVAAFRLGEADYSYGNEVTSTASMTVQVQVRDVNGIGAAAWTSQHLNYAEVHQSGSLVLGY